MTKLPEGWDVKTIGEICEVKGGKRLPKGISLVKTNTGQPYIRITDMVEGGVSLDDIHYVPQEVISSIQRYRIYTKDLFITVAGTLGLVGRIPPELNGANLTENADKLTAITIDRDYLELYLKSSFIQKAIEAEQTQNAQPKLAIERIKGFQIRIPCDAEQVAIAGVIKTWAKSIQEMEKLMETKREKKRALMQRLLTGKLRFPEFVGQAWQEATMGDVFQRITRRNAEVHANVVTISAQRGFVKQGEYFNKSVASETLDNYFLLHNGEFAYNKSYSNGYPMGAIKRLNNFDKGVVTTLYICFALKDETKACANFFEQFFEWGALNPGLTKVANEGGRAHGLLNVTPSDFFSLKLTIPGADEQRKIATVLSAADREIEQLTQKLSAYKQQKKGLMQQLLTGKKRVKLDRQEAA
jgi:type I restriction enzyme S subunit